VKVPNNAFASSFLKSEKLQRKRINYCSKHTVKMQWVVHKCLTGSVNLKRVERSGARCEAKQRSCYWHFLILRVSYTTSMLPTGKQLTRNSTWRSCDICVYHFTKNNRKSGDWILHHDIAPAYTSHLVQQFLVKYSTAQLQQLPYSPHLAPCDFFLFPRLKKVLKGH